MEVSAAVAALSSHNPGERLAAADFLKGGARLERGDKAYVAALVGVLESDDDNVREAAAAALGQIGPEARRGAVHALVGVVADRSVQVQLAAAMALQHIDPKATTVIRALVEAIEGGNKRVQQVAVIVLQRFGRAALPALKKVLSGARGDVRRVLTVALEAISSEPSVAKPQGKGDNGTKIVDDTTERTGVVQSPETTENEVWNEAEPSGQEDLLPSPAEQLQVDLVSRLKELIPALPPDAEGKVKAAIALNRALNQAFWEELRGELVPLITPLVHDIPSDYEGKRARATLVNGLLSTFNLAILIQDEHGRPHLCSLHPVRGRETDVKGNLRLREKTVSGSSQKSYAIPSPDELQIVEIPHQKSSPDPEPARTGRGG